MNFAENPNQFLELSEQMDNPELEATKVWLENLNPDAESLPKLWEIMNNTFTPEVFARYEALKNNKDEEIA